MFQPYDLKVFSGIRKRNYVAEHIKKSLWLGKGLTHLMMFFMF